MVYNYKQLNNGRWGIFIDSELVATIGCPNTCQKIIQFLETRLSQQNIPSLQGNQQLSQQLHYSQATETALTIGQYFQDMNLKP